MTDYFPKYYKKKQKRERLLGGITTVLFSVVVVCLAVLLAIYFVRFLKPGGPREGVKNEVEQKQKMDEKDQAKAATPTPTAAPKQPIQKVSIDDELKFGQSLPDVSISLTGMYGGKEPPGATKPNGNGQNGTDVSPGSQPGGAQPNVGAGAENGSGQGQQPAATADEQKAEQAKKEKAKAAEEKRKAREKAAQEKKVTQSKPPAPTGEPTYIYSVYAGQFKSRAEADTKRNELTQLGFSGAIVERVENEKPVYYLVVGDLYQDLQLALKLQERLKKAGFPGTVIHRRQKK